ncbi:MAG: arginine repressor [Gemmatimonadota bacterium]
MGSKQYRQGRIRELLQRADFGTHEQLAGVLRAEQVEVSQSTISKDLRELGVVRVPRPDGGFRYALPESGSTLRDRHILVRELQDYLLEVDRAGNIVVLRTVSGHAQSVCEAVDRSEWPELLGSIAGDNTIFLLCRTAQEAQRLVGRVAAVGGEAP